MASKTRRVFTGIGPHSRRTEPLSVEIGDGMCIQKQTLAITTVELLYRDTMTAGKQAR